MLNKVWILINYLVSYKGLRLFSLFLILFVIVFWLGNLQWPTFEFTGPSYFVEFRCCSILVIIFLTSVRNHFSLIFVFQHKFLSLKFFFFSHLGPSGSLWASSLGYFEFFVRYSIISFPISIYREFV